MRVLARIMFVLVCASGIACNTDPAKTAIPNQAVATQLMEAIDDAGLTVRLEKPAQRIISLIPSATETLIAIGATSQIVGRTRHDVAPEVMKLPSVGGGV
ncbi:MAG: ABC transporter substrate-binding protein, partial [Gemmatimonadaceae bacterium]